MSKVLIVFFLLVSSIHAFSQEQKYDITFATPSRFSVKNCHILNISHQSIGGRATWVSQSTSDRGRVKGCVLQNSYGVNQFSYWEPVLSGKYLLVSDKTGLKYINPDQFGSYQIMPTYLDEYHIFTMSNYSTTYAFIIKRESVPFLIDVMNGIVL